ncbi:hypothetical protein Tco_1294781 [Tanacetum coccineum]
MKDYKQENRWLIDEERAILFQQLLRNEEHFVVKRAEENRTDHQQKLKTKASIMLLFEENMEGWKPKDLKSKSFANIQELFDKAMKRVNTFVDYRTELVEGSSEKADAEIAQESKFKVFNKEDLETLYKLVKAKYGSTRPVEDLDLVLYGDLKIMFDPHVEDQGRIVRIKRLLDDLEVTAAKVCVTAAKQNTARVKLVLLEKIKENILSSYYCLYTVNAAGV